VPSTTAAGPRRRRKIETSHKDDGGAIEADAQPAPVDLDDPTPGSSGVRKRRRGGRAETTAQEGARDAGGKLPEEELQMLTQELCKAAGGHNASTESTSCALVLTKFS